MTVVIPREIGPLPIVVPVRRKRRQSVVERRYSLRRPCKYCPFRTDVPPYLRRERAREIVKSLVRGEFPCHETTIDVEDEDGNDDKADGPTSVHCAGADAHARGLKRGGRAASFGPPADAINSETSWRWGASSLQRWRVRFTSTAARVRDPQPPGKRAITV